MSRISKDAEIMEAQAKMDEFKYDVKYFTTSVATFRANVNTTDDELVHMLGDAVEMVQELFEGSQVAGVTVEKDSSNWLSFDKRIFSCLKSMFCNVCDISFPATRAGYNAHVASHGHKIRLIATNGDRQLLLHADDVKDEIKEEEMDVSGGDGNNNGNQSNQQSEVVSSLQDYTKVSSVISADVVDADAIVKVESWLDSNHHTGSDDDGWDIEQKPSPSLLEGTADTDTSDFEHRSNNTKVARERSANNVTPAKKIKVEGSHSGTSNGESSPNKPNQVVSTASTIQRRRPSSIRSDSYHSSKMEMADNGSDSQGSNGRYGELREFFEGDLTAVSFYAANKSKKISEYEWHKVITNSIETLLNGKFNMVKCHLIGSRVNQTAVDNNATLDIYLDLDHSYHMGKGKRLYMSSMVVVQKWISDSYNEWDKVRIMSESRFYILAATHIPSNVNCRILFGTGVFVGNNNLVNCLFDQQKVCRQLVLCIRQSMESVSFMNQPKKFTSYVLSLLVIFFFQMTGRLPAVQELQEHTAQEQCHEDNIAFRKPSGLVVCTDRLSALLMGFFKFYKNFSFTENIISIFEGCTIRHDVLETDDDSHISRTTKRFKRLSIQALGTWTRSLMCIQDIFLHRNNVTQTINANDIFDFQDFCKESFDILNKAANAGTLNY